MKFKLLPVLLLLCVAVVYGYFQYSSKQESIIPNRNLLKEVTILTSSYDGYSELW